MKPYVYIIQNLERTHWYVGYKQKPKAGEEYWGSSDYLDELIEQTGKENWTKTIIKEFDTWQEAKAHEDELLELMWDWDGRVNKARNGYVDFTDPQVKAAHQKAMASPEYIANHKAGCKIGAKKRSEDPVYRANREAMFQDPVYQANHKAGCKTGAQKRNEDPVWQANVAVANQKRAKPFIATNIATGEEYFCEKLSCDQVKALKLDQGNVSKCLNGEYPYPNYKGFTFRYND